MVPVLRRHRLRVVLQLLQQRHALLLPQPDHAFVPGQVDEECFLRRLRVGPDNRMGDVCKVVLAAVGGSLPTWNTALSV